MVVYFSRGGKTRRIAEAIAEELGCEAIDAVEGKPDLSGTDMLVVGSGNYGGAPHRDFEGFIEGIPTGNGSRAAVFATSGGEEPKCIGIMEEKLGNRGYNTVSSFDCRGQFLLVSRGHPDEEDVENARAFARDLGNGAT